jgi:hypothetical protein
MPAEAGIQAVGDNNNFKDLVSRFRGNDGVFPRYDTVSGEGMGGDVFTMLFNLTLGVRILIVTCSISSFLALTTLCPFGKNWEIFGIPYTIYHLPKAGK